MNGLLKFTLEFFRESPEPEVIEALEILFSILNASQKTAVKNFIKNKLEIRLNIEKTNLENNKILLINKLNEEIATSIDIDIAELADKLAEIAGL